MLLSPSPAAVAELVMGHQRLVYKAAHRYSRLKSLTWEELCSEGNVALFYAARAYDPGRGYAFSTFAVPCIYRAMTSAIRRRRGESDRPHRLTRPRRGVVYCTTGLEKPPRPPQIQSPDVSAHLAKLTQTERYIVARRFGLDDDPPQSFPEIAAAIGRTLRDTKAMFRRAVAVMGAGRHVL
jgi:RNA polymerase sigma factor (sigma-70 family)